MLPIDAVKEINFTSKEEADFIAAGYTKVDIKKFKLTPPKLAAFLELRTNNLTIEHLINFQHGSHLSFSYNHKNALVYLIRKKHMSVDNALAYINDINQDEAMGIASGLSKEDVKGLYQPKISILIAFKQFGLTKLAIQKCKYDFSYDNNIIETNALRYLIQIRKMSADDALAEIEDLSRFHLDALMAGYSRKEVIELNYFQTQALILFKQYGITDKQLRECQYLFSNHHLLALNFLLFVSKKNFVELIDIVNKIDETQAQAITNGEDIESILSSPRVFKC